MLICSFTPTPGKEPVVVHNSMTSPVWNYVRLNATAVCAVLLTTSTIVAAAPPLTEPVVARVEMKITDGEKVVNVIEQGDLLTVIEEREDDYVIVTHDGHRGAVDKVNAVRIAESGDIYTELIQREPNQGRFYTLRASSWWALGKADKALEDFDRAIELGYKESHAFVSRGLFHASVGNYEEAIADYEQALTIDPDDITPLINRAAVYMMQAEYEKAVKDYSTAFLQDPERKSLLHQRAIAHKAAGMLDKAAEDFSAILDDDPADIVAVMGRGYIHFQTQNHEAAIKDFSTAIELQPQNAVAFNNRGYNRSKLGNFADALEDYQQALKLSPTYTLAMQNRAWLLATVDDAELRDPAAAVKLAKQACELTNYESIGDLSALAAALAADGQFEEAVGWQEKVVEAVADSYQDFAQKNLERYQNERPFAADPDKANAEERAAAEQAAKAEAEAEAAKINAAKDETIEPTAGANA
jgi:tetratricopeptide (TPR) repeat protein